MDDSCSEHCDRDNGRKARNNAFSETMVKHLKILDSF